MGGLPIGALMGTFPPAQPSAGPGFLASLMGAMRGSPGQPSGGQRPQIPPALMQQLMEGVREGMEQRLFQVPGEPNAQYMPRYLLPGESFDTPPVMPAPEPYHPRPPSPADFTLLNLKGK